ncbi:MAG: hypothetical protein JO347_01935, partial [Candidatus Eremiobacteraeota bacterium]|nr:hypothetical protein [Candidatus Eremiobacteraeota bacterium]
MPRRNHAHAARGEGAERLIEGVVDLFVASPMATLDAVEAARALGVSPQAAAEALDILVRLGIATARLARGTQTYQFRIADEFLDILERLTRFYTDQLETVAILPERALLSSGEAVSDLPTVRALRARIASLETANTLLQRKNLELSFLYNASTLLASSIEPMTLAQAVLDAIGAATNMKARAYFVALVDQEMLTFQGGMNINKRSAEAFLTRHAALIDAAIEKGSLISIPRQGRIDRTPEPPFVVLPLRSGPDGRGHGCIAITDIAQEGLS